MTTAPPPTRGAAPPATTWVCVHGHFYQPPRENPWLEAIEPQTSARPYPDWNARITAECYRPNAAARILDGAGNIVRIVDNYERISFNVGPTLMSWFEREAPDVHAAVIEADKASAVRFGGHGSAMAQAYNHLIMPLASRRDKRTQVRWGIRDFRHRFGRAPEGMWLPECAVDTESLEVLAEEGITFTVLAPNQARRVKEPAGEWEDVSGGRVDPGRVYRCALPSGRSIDLFFYDGATAQAVAFERLLADGGKLAERLSARRAEPGGHVLSHIATDGETYGHHHRYGDMALAWALQVLERGPGTRITNYAEFRTRFPATWAVEIVEDTSWSCAHGVSRWREDCGCSSGGHPGWNQAWRRPLRDALDWLRDRAADVFETASFGLLPDPWAARDAYVDVVLARGAPYGGDGVLPAMVDGWLTRHAGRVLTADEGRRALQLLEQQRHALLMYTSCGWFFDDLSGIETVQILQYAARVCELTEALAGGSVEAGFVERLAAASSNLPAEGDGRALWRARVVPARVDLPKVVAHHAVSSLIETTPGTAWHPGVELRSPTGRAPTLGPDEPRPPRQRFLTEPRGPQVRRVYCYEVATRDLMVRRTGKARLIAGTVGVTSTITRDTAELSFAALHVGEHHLIGGVKPFPGDAWQAVVEQLADAFLSADLLTAQRTLDRFFEGRTFTLGSLFGVERHRALERILAEPLGAAVAAFAKIYDEYGPLMRYLVNHDLPVPEVFHTAAEFTLRTRLLHELASETASFAAVRAQIAEARQVQVDLDTPEVAYAASEGLHALIDRLVTAPDDLEALERTVRLAEIAARMQSGVDRWHAQNAAWTLMQQRLPTWQRRAAAGDVEAGRLAEEFLRLCAALRIAVPATVGA